MLLYGEISDQTWWGDEVTPKQLAEDLQALGSISALNVRINSYGGDVFAANAIYNILRRHQASVTVIIDGIAASAATIIAMAGDKVVMPANAMMMVHNPWTFAMGNADELRQMADTLDAVRGTILAAYMDKTGLSQDDLVALMDAETWLTAQECIDQGFADEIEEQVRVAASVRGRALVVGGVSHDLSRMKVKPAALIQVHNGVIEYEECPVWDDKERPWDAQEAVTRLQQWASSDGSGDKDKVDWDKYGSAFTWCDSSMTEDFDGYKLPHHDVIDGKLYVLYHGVTACGDICMGGRGGVDIPESDMDGVQEHLAKHYAQFDEKAPWEEGDDTGDGSDGDEGEPSPTGDDPGADDRVATAVATERARIKALDELNIAGAEDIVFRAKYQTGETADQVALEILKSPKAAGMRRVADLADDARTSGANGVRGSRTPQDSAAETHQAKVSKAVAFLRRLRGLPEEG